jgi:hypothetical protein
LPILGGNALRTEAEREAGGRIVSIPPITLVERLELLVFMTSMAMSCGLLVLISAQAGKSDRAWVWALVFAVTSLLTDLLFWRQA